MNDQIKLLSIKYFKKNKSDKVDLPLNTPQTRKCCKHDHIWKYDKNLHDCQTSRLTNFVKRGADLL